MWCMGGDRDTSDLPPRGWQHPAAVLPIRAPGSRELLFLLGMVLMLCQSSGCAVIIPVLLEILGRQPLVPGRESPALVPAPAVLTSFPDLLSLIHVKKGKPKTSQNHLPPWLKVQIEGFLFCLTKQAHSVLEYHWGVFVRETGSTKSHFSSQHRQKMTERDLGPSLSLEGDYWKRCCYCYLV